jgi:hypothetical protein
MMRMTNKKTLINAGLTILLLSPVAAGAATSNTIISSDVSAVIGVFTTNGTVNVDVTPSGAGAQTIASDTVTISTNAPGGYTLQLAESTAQTALVSGSDTIPAISGTQASPAAASANTWGYRVDGIGGFGAGPTSAASNQPIGSLTFAAVPATASPNTIKATSSTATNDTTTIWYQVSVDTSTPPGTYTNTVVYTAVTN